MKKADVLQLTIIILGIVFGFSALKYLFIIVFGFFAWLLAGDFGIENYYGASFDNMAVVGLEVLSCWFLITRSNKLAAFLYKKSNLGKSFKVISNPNDLLYILLISIGIYFFLENIGPLLLKLFESFKGRSPNGVSGLFDDGMQHEWPRLILNVLLPLILIVFAKPIAHYFAKKISEEKISIEESAELNED